MREGRPNATRCRHLPTRRRLIASAAWPYQNGAVDEATSPALGSSAQCHHPTNLIVASRASPSPAWSSSWQSTSDVGKWTAAPGTSVDDLHVASAGR